MPLRLAIDFDRTLFLNDFPLVGQPVPGALEHLRKLKQDGHYIVIWSARANRLANPGVARELGIEAMVQAIREHGIPHDAIDFGDQGKVRADVYIDDHGLGTPTLMVDGQRVVDWPLAYRLIRLYAVQKRLGHRSGRTDDEREWVPER